MIASTNVYSVVEAATIMGGICMVAAIIGMAFYAVMREEKDRALMPWGARSRVEKARAHTEVMQQHLQQDALEVKRLAIEHQRTRVMNAIAQENHEEVERLGLPSSKPSDRDSAMYYPQ